MAVHDLLAGERLTPWRSAVKERIAGDRVYDARVAEVARAAGAAVVITDNRRHFLSALPHGLRVERPAEFLAALEGRRV